jgi:hypothetical protein
VGRVGVKIDSPAIFHLGDDAAGVRAVVGTGSMNALDSHNLPSLACFGHDDRGAGKKQILAYFFPIWLG